MMEWPAHDFESTEAAALPDVPTVEDIGPLRRFPAHLLYGYAEAAAQDPSVND